MPHLRIVKAGRDIEAAVPPPMPHGGEKRSAVPPVRGEHRHESKLEQIAEIGEVQASSHGGDPTQGTRRGVAPPGSAPASLRNSPELVYVRIE
jgi:hypothetical protein